MSRFTALALAAASLALAACADSTKVTGPGASPPAGPTLDATRDRDGNNATWNFGNDVSERNHFDAEGNSPDIRHVHGMRGGSRAAGGRGSRTLITYHGGPVLQSGTKVAAIYWSTDAIYNGGPAPGATGTGAQDGSLIGAFLRGIGGSPYFKINTTYTDGSGHAIVNSVTYTQFWANNSFNVPSGTQSVSDAKMIAMLQYAFNNGKLTYDAGTLYHIFTAGKVNLGGGFGTQYCAYHTHGTVVIGGVSRTVLYSAAPYDYAYPTACSENLAVWPNGDAGADAEVNTLAHETEETTTDMMGNAWYDGRGYENADKCAWAWGTTFTTPNGSTANVVIGGRNWLVQMNWVNSGAGFCANTLP